MSNTLYDYAEMNRVVVVKPLVFNDITSAFAGSDVKTL